jgi:ABC-type Fe3+-siderophore transport system permease subunit
MESIGSILGLIALLGFAGFVGGVGLIVVAASQGRPVRGGLMLALIGVIVGLVFSVVSQGILVVKPTERAVIVNTLTGELEPPRGPGTSVVIPIVQVYTIYPISQQQYTMSGRETEGQVRGNDGAGAYC